MGGSVFDLVALYLTKQVQSRLLEYGRTAPRTLPKNSSDSPLSLRLPPPPGDGTVAVAAAGADGAVAATRYAAVASGDDAAADIYVDEEAAAAAAAAASAALHTIGARVAPEEQRGGFVSRSGDGEAEVGGRGIGGSVGSDSEGPRRRVWV